MALLLNEEQTMLRDSARGFMADNAPIAELRKLRDSRSADGFSRPLWSRFAEMGFTGLLLPESHGGLSLGFVEAGVVMEEIGRNLTASPYLASSIVAATAVLRGGSEAQKLAWLPRIASGELIATLAVDESAKHRPDAIALKAEKSAEGYTLHGSKTFVLDGHVAGLLIIAARTSGAVGDPSGITLFAVDPGLTGLRVERTTMLDAHNAARLRFEGVTVAAGAVLGSVGEGLAPLNAALDAGRACAAAELLGIADETFSRTLTYMKERRQFDRLIGEFQALQHRAAHLYCEIEFMRATVIHALQSLNTGDARAGSWVAIAKAKAGSVATLAVQEAVQLHGGMGMTDEFDMGLFMKRARTLQELWGDANHHADRLARDRHY